MRNSDQQEMLGNTCEQGGSKAQRELFSFAPCNTLGEESISPSDQVTGVGSPCSQRILHHNWQRVTAQMDRTRRDGTPWAKRHHCRLGPMPNLQQRPKRPADQTHIRQTTQDHRHTTDLERVRTRNGREREMTLTTPSLTRDQCLTASSTRAQTRATNVTCALIQTVQRVKDPFMRRPLNNIAHVDACCCAPLQLQIHKGRARSHAVGKRS